MLDGALKQAKEARTAILAVLNAAIDAPDEMAMTAPRVISVQIPVDKIGELIGPKGKTINQIQDDTGADISIEEDGTVYIGAVDGESAEAARSAVNAIANPHNPEVGERFLGTVVKLATFGAFVSLMPGRDGLLHISEVRKLAGGKRVENVEDVLGVGQKIQVEITKVDDRGKLSLSPVVDETTEPGDTQSSVACVRRPRGTRRRLNDRLAPKARPALLEPARAGRAFVVRHVCRRSRMPAAEPPPVAVCPGALSEECGMLAGPSSPESGRCVMQRRRVLGGIVSVSPLHGGACRSFACGRGCRGHGTGWRESR